MDKANIPATVDDYLKAVPEPARSALLQLRKAIQAAAPEAEEVISYQMPAYRYKGMLVYFAAFTNHCSLFGVSDKMLDAFSEELKPFKRSGKGTVQFTPDKPLPAILVKKMVKMRLRENEEREAAKKKP